MLQLGKKKGSTCDMCSASSVLARCLSANGTRQRSRHRGPRHRLSMRVRRSGQIRDVGPGSLRQTVSARGTCVEALHDGHGLLRPVSPLGESAGRCHDEARSDRGSAVRSVRRSKLPLTVGVRPLIHISTQAGSNMYEASRSSLSHIGRCS